MAAAAKTSDSVVMVQFIETNAAFQTFVKVQVATACFGQCIDLVRCQATQRVVYQGCVVRQLTDMTPTRKSVRVFHCTEAAFSLAQAAL